MGAIICYGFMPVKVLKCNHSLEKELQLRQFKPRQWLNITPYQRIGSKAWSQGALFSGHVLSLLFLLGQVSFFITPLPKAVFASFQNHCFSELFRCSLSLRYCCPYYYSIFSLQSFPGGSSSKEEFCLTLDLIRSSG